MDTAITFERRGRSVLVSWPVGHDLSRIPAVVAETKECNPTLRVKAGPAIAKATGRPFVVLAGDSEDEAKQIREGVEWSAVSEFLGTDQIVECRHCRKVIREGSGIPELGVYDKPTGEEFCSEDCRDSASERAYERFVERYYGGDSPVTLREECDAAWRNR